MSCWSSITNYIMKYCPGFCCLHSNPNPNPEPDIYVEYDSTPWKNYITV